MLTKLPGAAFGHVLPVAVGEAGATGGQLDARHQAPVVTT